jgi:hypothetical protein
LTSARPKDRTGMGGRSVVVGGVAGPVTDLDEVQRLTLLRIWPWADGVSRQHWVRISAHQITGRQIVHHYDH